MNQLKFHTIFLITLFVYACNNNPAETERVPNVLADVAVEIVPVKPPLSVAILDDQSGSRRDFGIPPIETSMLTPFLDYIKEYGGQISVGIIEANSEKVQPVFLRIPPSILENPQKPIEPIRGDYRSDFTFRDAMRDYRKKVEIYNQQLEAVEVEKQKIKSRNKTLVEHFIERFEELMSQNFNWRRTDIDNAINKTLPFHKHAPEGSRKITILISDGIHNRRDSSLDDPRINEIEYLLVPGSVGLEDQQWLKATQAIFVPDYQIMLDVLGIEYFPDS